MHAMIRGPYLGNEQIIVELSVAVLTAWSISGKLAQTTLMTAWGGLATITSPIVAITISGILLLGTPLLLPNRYVWC